MAIRTEESLPASGGPSGKFYSPQDKLGAQIFGGQSLLPPQPSTDFAPVKRVLLTTESFLPKVDGVSKTSYITARYLQETGRDVMIVAPDNGVRSFGQSRVEPVCAVTIPQAKELKIGLPSIRLIKYIHAFKPDLIHFASPAMLPIFGVCWGAFKNIPMVATYQTDYINYIQLYGFGAFRWLADLWPRFEHNLCDVNLVPSETVCEALTARKYQRMSVWQHGVDLERFHPNKSSQSVRQRLLAGRAETSLLCLYVGRLAPEKDVGMLHAVAKMPGVALTIVGDGDDRERLEQVFADTDAHFTGYIYQDDLASVYASADVALVTGPYETFGLVVQEGMASGVPTVVTNRGAAKDLIQDGETGFVVEHTQAGFTGAISAFLANPKLMHQMGQAARKDAEKRPWWKIMQDLEAHYKRALEHAKQS